MTIPSPSPSPSPTHSPSTAQKPGNAAGTTAFVLAVAYVVVGIALTGVTSALPALLSRSGVDPTTIGLAFTVVAVVQLLLAAVVTLVGVIGVVRRGAPRILAGIAVGVGGSGLVLGSASLIVPPLVAAIVYA